MLITALLFLFFVANLFVGATVLTHFDDEDRTLIHAIKSSRWDFGSVSAMLALTLWPIVLYLWLTRK